MNTRLYISQLQPMRARAARVFVEVSTVASSSEILVLRSRSSAPASSENPSQRLRGKYIQPTPASVMVPVRLASSSPPAAAASRSIPIAVYLYDAAFSRSAWGSDRPKYAEAARAPPPDPPNGRLSQI